MNEYESLSADQLQDLAVEHRDWRANVREHLADLRGDNDDSGRGDVFADLWERVSDLVGVGPVIDIATSRRLRQKIGNELGSVRMTSPEVKAADLRTSFEDFYPTLAKAYEDGGDSAALSEVAHLFRFARYQAQYGEETFRRVANVAADLRGEMAELAAAETRAREILDEARAAATAAAESVKEATSAATAAREAAGKAGTNNLATEFGNFTKDHKKASRTYRAWTIAVLVLAVFVAIIFVAGLDRVLLDIFGMQAATRSDADPISNGSADGQRWQAVVYRLAILGGLAALSAYLGRQAALHRRLQDWGRAVEAQALSFEAFAKQIVDPETKKQVQLLFSQRVLGSPPEPSADKTIARDALQIIADAALKGRPS